MPGWIPEVPEALSALALGLLCVCGVEAETWNLSLFLQDCPEQFTHLWGVICLV
jgi:hypothetical protein